MLSLFSSPRNMITASETSSSYPQPHPSSRPYLHRSGVLLVSRFSTTAHSSRLSVSGPGEQSRPKVTCTSTCIYKTPQDAIPSSSNPKEACKERPKNAHLPPCPSLRCVSQRLGPSWYGLGAVIDGLDVSWAFLGVSGLSWVVSWV